MTRRRGRVETGAPTPTLERIPHRLSKRPFRLIQPSSGLPPEPFDFVTLKAFDTDGAPLYEYKMGEILESHDGIIWGLEVRDITETATWTSFSDMPLNYTISTDTQTPPAKDGTSPHVLPIRQWALDSVKIVRATGVKTTKASNVDYLWKAQDVGSTDGFSRYGVPSMSLRTVLPQQHKVTEAGLGIGYPTQHAGRNGAFAVVQFFDYWVQSVTSVYRIHAGWCKPITGAPSQWTFANGASSATFAYNATAATIKTALETITGVTSATVTGGPLPLFHVDITVVWTTTIGQFTAISISNMFGPLSGSIGLYDYETGSTSGRSEVEGVITSDDLAIIKTTTAGVVSRHTIGSDAFGVLVPSAGPVWTGTKITTPRTAVCAGASTTVGMRACVGGKAVLAVNRSTSGTTLTHTVISESTGTVEGDGDSFMDTPTSVLFRSTTLVEIYGIDDCALKMSGGEQYTEMGTAGGAATTSHMISGFYSGSPVGYDATHVVMHGATDTESDGIISRVLTPTTTFADHTITSVIGGDAFFPTATYNRHNVKLFAENQYYNTDLEWRLLLGPGVDPDLFATAWFAYGASDATVMAELDLWFGDNSALLPVISLPFATVDNVTTSVPWYARAPELVITAEGPAGHGLMPNSYRMSIEIRLATVRLQRSMGKIKTSDSTVVWQADVGVPALAFTQQLTPTSYEHDVVVCHAWRPQRLATHPAVVTGPL